MNLARLFYSKKDWEILQKEKEEKEKIKQESDKIKEEKAKTKEEEDNKIFGEKLKKYKKKFLLNHNYEPFYIWGYDAKKKEVLCIFPDSLQVIVED